VAIDAKDQIHHRHIRRVQHYHGWRARPGVKRAQNQDHRGQYLIAATWSKLAVPWAVWATSPGPLTPAGIREDEVARECQRPVHFAFCYRLSIRRWCRLCVITMRVGMALAIRMGWLELRFPMGARILSVVVRFDALTSDRPRPSYRRGSNQNTAKAFGTVTIR